MHKPTFTIEDCRELNHSHKIVGHWRDGDVDLAAMAFVDEHFSMLEAFELVKVAMQRGIGRYIVTGESS